MAGSSLSLAWRDPFLEYALETPVDEALAIGYGGLESYGFHALEVLQCMVERRRGGETGIASVQCLEGEAVWRAGNTGRWSRELAEAACGVVDALTGEQMTEACSDPAVFLIEHVDGLHTATLMLNGYVRQMAYAGRVAGDVQATLINSANGAPHPHFSYLSLNIQRMFVTGRPQYPVERALLVTGALDALMTSRHSGHTRVETPHLRVAYTSYDELPIRPTEPRPRGASLGSAGGQQQQP